MPNGVTDQFTAPAQVAPQLDQQMPVATPAPAAPVAPPAEPAPEFTATGRAVSTRTTQTERTPGIEKQLSELDAAKALQEQAVQQQMKAAQDIGRIEAEAATSEAAVMQDFAVKQQAAAAEANAKIQDANARVQSMQAEMEAQSPESFWGSKSTGQKIGLGIALALGAFGQGMTGGPNTALQVINGQMNDFMSLQRRKADQKLKAIELRKGDVQTQRQARVDAMSQLAAQEQAAIGQVRAQIQSKLAIAKSQDQIAKLQQLDAELANQAASKQLEFEQQLAPTVAQDSTEQLIRQTAGTTAETITDAGKPMTDTQLKASGFLERAEPALQGVEGFEDEVFADKEKFEAFKENMTEVARASSTAAVPVIGGFLEAITPSKAKLAEGEAGIVFGGEELPGGSAYLAQAEDFIRTMLRKESGAAIASDEFDNEYKRFFYVAGDTPQSLRKKKAARRNAIRGLRKETGKVAKPLFYEGK